VVFGRTRPPSPLRHAITADPETGELSEDGSFVDDDEDAAWGERPKSPSESMAKLATNFAQRFGSFVNNMSAPSSQQHLPTDEELEAEAERERERTRREAELIMAREAQTRRLEERVLAMIDSDMRKTMTMTPPVVPSTPSPASSPKEGGSWLSTVKNKLTPTKEPLTPAQQIIQDAKAREKEMEKEEKKLEKERKEAERELKKQTKKQAKQRSGEWPSSSEGKLNDPALLQLTQPQPAPSRHMTASPSSPSPARQHSMPPSLAPSPMRVNEAGTSSPSRSGPPLYAQFNAQGTLDVAATLLTIASRFEKLERWTVGHVRALEERMDDVEGWLVEKEKEREESGASGPAVTSHKTGEPPNMNAAIAELRDELAEVQGRIGELGREMAKMVTAPANLSSGPSRPSTSINRAPSTNSSIAVSSMSSGIAPGSTPPQRQGSASPPVSTSPIPSNTPSRTRLPYPTGDYATPPDTVFLSQGPFSPPGSPPQAEDIRRLSLSGLPSSDGLDYMSSNGNSPSGLPSTGPSSPPSLPRPPQRPELRQASVSPTPRKRYTVALGGSIMGSSRDQSTERPMTPHSRSQSRGTGSAIFSSSPKSMTASFDTTDDDDSDTGANEETIGKAAARNSGLAKNDSKGSSSRRLFTPSSDNTMPLPTQPLKPTRTRPQSMYSGFGPSHNIAAPRPITPLNTRLRTSRSTDKLMPSSVSSDAASSSALPPVTPTSGRFVDPLLVRRQTKEAAAVNAAQSAPKVMPGKPKVPIGELVAYFNKEKA
jgi:hypothetical protein